MKVKALKSFGGANKKGRYHYSAGDIFDLPKGADWLRVGLVEKVVVKKRTATRKPKEKATGRGQD